MRLRFAAAIAAVLVGTGLGSAVAEQGAGGAAAEADGVQFAMGDPAAGEGLFRLCSQCHTVVPNQNRLGPTLFGVIGREAAALPGFRYSPAMRDSGIVWTPEALDTFLETPTTVVPRSRMAFTGISDPEQRANIIAYLMQFSTD